MLTETSLLYAVGKQSIRKLSLPGDHLDSEHEEVQTIIQQWMYPPEIFIQPGGKWVDSLSLYFSLRNSPDDRVIQELISFRFHTSKNRIFLPLFFQIQLILLQLNESGNIMINHFEFT